MPQSDDMMLPHAISDAEGGGARLRGGGKLMKIKYFCEILHIMYKRGVRTVTPLPLCTPMMLKML